MGREVEREVKREMDEKVYIIPYDNEERTILDWWIFEFDNNYRKLTIGYLAERIEVNSILGKHTVEYFLPQDFVVTNKIITYQKWKENLPIMHNLSRNVTIEYRLGKTIELLTSCNQTVLEKDEVISDNKVEVSSNEDGIAITIDQVAIPTEVAVSTKVAIPAKVADTDKIDKVEVPTKVVDTTDKVAVSTLVVIPAKDTYTDTIDKVEVSTKVVGTIDKVADKIDKAAFILRYNDNITIINEIKLVTEMLLCYDIINTAASAA